MSDWNPEDHPRWPENGEFSPQGEGEVIIGRKEHATHVAATSTRRFSPQLQQLALENFLRQRGWRKSEPEPPPKRIPRLSELMGATLEHVSTAPTAAPAASNAPAGNEALLFDARLAYPLVGDFDYKDKYGELHHVTSIPGDQLNFAVRVIYAEQSGSLQHNSGDAAEKELESRAVASTILNRIGGDHISGGPQHDLRQIIRHGGYESADPKKPTPKFVKSEHLTQLNASELKDYFRAKQALEKVVIDPSARLPYHGFVAKNSKLPDWAYKPRTIGGNTFFFITNIKRKK